MWWLKVLIQFCLAMVPGGEFVNFQLQQAVGSYRPDRTRARVIELAGSLPAIRRHLKLEQAIAVEVGTGWDAIGALVLYTAGVAAVHTFDHLRHARLSLVKDLLRQLELEANEIAIGARIAEESVRARIDALRVARTLDELFGIAGIRYVGPGDATNTGLPDCSVDLFFSFAVLEHVPEEVIAGLTMESRRILRAGGICYHLIGLGDHYRTGRGCVNFLKYPEWLWRLFVKNRISFHNRLREKQFVELFSANGAELLDITTQIDPADLEFLSSIHVARRFKGMTAEELAPWRTEVVLGFP